MHAGIHGAPVEPLAASLAGAGGGAAELWAGPLAGGDAALVLLNAQDGAATGVRVDLARDLGLAAGTVVSARDLWANTTTTLVAGAQNLTVDVEAHSVVQAPFYETKCESNLQLKALEAVRGA